MAIAERELQQEQGKVAIQLDREALEALRDVTHCASKDSSRQVLTMVQLRKGHAYATDSYVMVKRSVAEFEGEYLFPAKQIADACKQALKGSGGAVLMIEGKMATLSFLEGGAVLPNMVDEYDFPRCDQLIPDYTPDDKVPAFGIDPFKVVRVAKALGQAKEDGRGVKVQGRDGLKPFLVTRNGTEGIGLVMPVRLA